MMQKNNLRVKGSVLCQGSGGRGCAGCTLCSTALCVTRGKRSAWKSALCMYTTRDWLHLLCDGVCCIHVMA